VPKIPTQSLNGKPLIPADKQRLDAIPAELRALPRWACWREEASKDGKKPGKPPINTTRSYSGRHA
jgi:primase-polymerase (primpol)-like protein